MSFADRLARVEKRCAVLQETLSETRQRMHRLAHEIELCRGTMADEQMRMAFAEAIQRGKEVRHD